MGPDITCRDFAEFLDDYLAGALPEADLAAFNAHLAACPSCVAYMKTYEASIRLGKNALAGPDLPADVPEDLVRAVVAAVRKS